MRGTKKSKVGSAGKKVGVFVVLFVLRVFNIRFQSLYFPEAAAITLVR